MWPLAPWHAAHMFPEVAGIPQAPVAFPVEAHWFALVAGSMGVGRDRDRARFEASWGGPGLTS